MDYHLFREIDGNRPSNDKRKDLEERMRTFGWVYPIICVLKNGVLNIIDGQHRFKVAVALRLPIYYIEWPAMTDEEEINFIAGLNSTAKSWKPNDYVDAWAALGKIPYIQVQQLAERHQCTYTVVMDVCCVDYRKQRKAMHNGELELDAHLKGTTVLNYVAQLKQVIPFSGRMIQGFNKFYMAHQDTFNIKEFKKKLKENVELLKDITERQVFAQVFEKIWNDQ